MTDLVERAQQARNRRILERLGGKPAEEAAILLADEVTALRSLVGETADEITRLQSALTEARAQGEVMRGGLDSALAEIDGLRAAIDAGDPKAELLVRVGDVRRIVSASLSTPPTAVARVIEAARKVNAATFSHVDGRDLLAELHPRKELDIKRRKDGVETWFEGDWLTNVYQEIEPLREALANLDGGRK